MIASGRTCVSRRRRPYCRWMNSIAATSSGMTMMISQAPRANFATAKITVTIAGRDRADAVDQPRSAASPPSAARAASGGPCPACDRVIEVKTPIA